jgi:hypothetical protein
MRRLSNGDDFLSNLLVTVFQILTLFSLWIPGMIPFYFIYSGILFVYIPLGKLRHLLYFFAARFYLGWFYGKRGVWPPARHG